MTKTLLTGGSGFIGTYLTKWFLANTEDTIVALVRARDDHEAKHRLARAWEDHPELINALDRRVEALAGDVSKERFGLDENRYADLIRDVGLIVHSAADIRLNAPLEELRRTNVEGTRHIIAFALSVHKDHGLKRLAHVSTAYVAGDRKGPVLESELSDKHGFMSNYEQSKFESEALVKEQIKDLPISIFRPGMVVGSSEDGYVRTFNTLYYPLRLCLSGKLRVLPVSPFHQVNLVPVDYVAESIGRLSLDHRAAGRTFHVVGDPSTLPTVGEMVDLTRAWAREHLKTELPRPIYLPSLLGKGLAERGSIKNLAPLAPYLYDGRVFQRNDMDELLGPYPVDWRQLLPRLLEFATYHGFMHRSDRTVHEQVLFRLQSKSRPVRLYDIVDGKVRERSADEVRRDMLVAASALRSFGIKKGDRVAIVGANSTRFLTLDVAIGLIGAVSVPLYYTSPPGELSDQIKSSQAKVLLVGSVGVLERVGEMGLHVPIISFCSSTPGVQDSKVINWEEFMERGGEASSERSPADFADLATLRYTSSTTGHAKGVLFTQRHLRFMAESTASLPPWQARNSEVFYLSFLPMNHVVEGILATYSPFYAPSPINLYFLEEFKELRKALPTVRPTIFFSVPRFYEKMHDSLMASPMARDVLNHPKGLTASLLAPLIKRKALRLAGLDRCAYLISGSGVMSPAILRDLEQLGIEVHNAYGLTEAPLVTINYPGRNRMGTVGEPLPRTEVTIGEDGEVLVRGPQVTSGYEGGASSLTDGWLPTGDIGRLTKGGSLVLEGRKKELIKTSYGKYVNPSKVETMLRDLPGVAEAMVVGEGRPYGAALLWMDGKADAESLDAAIPLMNTQLSHPEQVKAWALLPNDLSIERGELTANMKIRRTKILQRYDEVIEALYSTGGSSAEALHIGRAGRDG
jgi:long-chain acyl-CoA synthetase